MYVLFCAILLVSFGLVPVISESRNLTLKEGDKNITLFCYNNNGDERSIQQCRFVFFNETIKKHIVTKDGTVFDIRNCSIIIASIKEFEGADKIECRIQMGNVTENETPIVYHIYIMESNFVMWAAVGGGVVGGAVLVGVMTYIILKIKALASAKAAARPSGISPKSVEAQINKPDVERYVTEPKKSQVRKGDDFGCPAVVVAPIPDRKKKKKIEKPPPQHFPEDEEGHYEEIGMLPIKGGNMSSHPPPINLSTLPRDLSQSEKYKPKYASQTNSLQHKKKRYPPPTKPRAGTMESSAMRSTPDSNDQPPKHPNIKRQPPVKEKPKEIAIKEKQNVKVPVAPNFMGELNMILGKQPNVTGFKPITVRPDIIQNDDDAVSYESIDITKGFSDSRDMSKPLIEDTDRRAPHPFPKPKPSKPYKEKTHEKPKKTESISMGVLNANKNQETDHTPKSVFSNKPKPAIPVPEKPVKSAPVKPVKPVIKPTFPAKSVFTGKSPDQLPSDVIIKEKWNPTPLKKQGGNSSVPTITKPLPKEDASETSYESVSSDEDFENYKSTSWQTQGRKPPMPTQHNDVDSQLYEPVSDGEHQPMYHQHNRSDNYTDELSSGEEWDQLDYIHIESQNDNAPGSIPGHRPISPEGIYYDPNTNTGNDWRNGASSVRSGSNAVQKGASSVRSGSNAAQNGASSVRSGSNAVQKGASSVRSGSNAVKNGASLVQSGTPQDSVNDVVNKPLPPLPQENIYENIEEMRPSVPFRLMKF